jgi:trk/ktr system potassium uptake protein
MNPKSFSMKALSKLFNLNPSQALVFGFLALVAVGTLLLCLPLSAADGTVIHPLQALFTSTSAVCVTGLVVVDTGTAYSRFGQVVILCLFQLGGLGIMLFSTALVGVFGRKLGLKERVLVHQTSPGLPLSEVGTLARNIVLFTLACELVGFLVLSMAWAGRLGWQAPFYALFHSVSAFCNAGFSLWADSLSADVSSSIVNSIMILLITMGGFGYLVCRDLHQSRAGRLRRLSLHSHIVLTTSVSLVLGGTLLFWFFEAGNPATLGGLDFGGRFWASLFQSVTTRTAGFNTISIGDLREETLLLMIFLMFIGGSPGSTAGGIKTTTFALLLLAAGSQMRNQPEVVVRERKIPMTRVLQALSLTIVAFSTVLLCALVMNYLEPSQFRQVLFETVSAIATVGLSTGITAELSSGSMILICVMMFMGRVGPLTLAAFLFSRSKPKKEIRFPCGEISIG